MSTTTATTLDMSRLPAPTLLPVDYEALRGQMLAKFLACWDEARARDSSLPAYSVEQLESDPAGILTQEFAYFDILLRNLANDLADTLRLARASGPDLDHLATTYHNTPRLQLTPATDTAAATYEGDDEYRARAQLAPEALAQYGITPGGYIQRIKSLFGDRVLDVAAVRTGGGGLDLVILGRDGDGTPSPELIGDIAAAFAGEDASQSTDIVTVRAAQIRPAAVHIVLGIRRGPEPASVIGAATKAAAALAAERHRIGETLHVQALGAAARVAPARWARVVSPAGDVEGGAYGAPHVTSLLIAVEVEP